uniref:uncharacterized protein LOC122604433 n=1 Tax=Erigeron canadensis TaxID=72917 RepID=UPI001CB88C65|nr:uncharacterized protein LOC122604433 [Erigeron canadensis]
MKELPKDIDKLPKEITLDIFSRFTLKFLCQIRSVCKSWCSLIDDIGLAILVTELAQHGEEPMPLMVKHIPEDPCKLWFLLTFKSTYLGVTYLKMTKDPVYEFKRDIWSKGYNLNLVEGSCNGLIYSIKDREDRYHGTTTFVVMDLSRKRSYMVPHINFPSGLMLSSGLGFDSWTGTFKMVCVFYNKPVVSLASPLSIDLITENLVTMVHVLGTDSWRTISNVMSYPTKGEGVFAHGCIHWLFACLDLHQLFEGKDGRNKVVCFNVAQEEFALIDLPRQTIEGERVDHLVDLLGEVGLVFDNVGESVMEVWVLKQKKLWVIHCRFSKSEPLKNGIIRVIGYWNKDRDILLTININTKKRLFVYCLKSRVVCEEIKFEHCKYGRKTEIRMYQRSLFSIPSNKNLIQMI